MTMYRIEYIPKDSLKTNGLTISKLTVEVSTSTDTREKEILAELNRLFTPTAQSKLKLKAIRQVLG